MGRIEIDDLFALRFPSAPALSPGGAYCAFLVHTGSLEDDCYHTEIWAAAADGTGARPWVCGRAPRTLLWIDEETLLFTEVRDGRTECAVVPLDGGAPRAAFTLPLACTGLWRLDADTYLAQAALPGGTHGRVEVLEEIPFWANGRGFTSGQRSALFLWHAGQALWEPVGPQEGEISFVSVSGPRAYYAVRYRTDRKMKFSAVRRFDLSTGTDEEIVPPDIYDVFWAGEIDGHIRLYATNMKRYGNVENPCFYAVTENGPVLLADYDEGPTNDVTSDARYGSSTQYAVDGAWLYYIVTRNGCSQLARVDAAGVREILTQARGTVDGITAAHGCVCAVAARGARSAELYCLDGGAELPLTDLNGAYFASHDAVPVTSWHFVQDRLEIEGFALLPPGFDPSRRYPAVLQVHGGPKLAYGPVFHHEMQMLCAQGYFVLFCNPRGSDGRGNAFMDVRGRWGQEDCRDILAFLEDALARWPQIDRDRIGVCGGSYGGFMVNWLIGHTNRFACAVSQRGISNMVSMFGTSDIGYRFVADQCAATPWDDPALLWRQSPLAYAHRVQTPTLFIHGAEDARCDRSEAMQMFTALRLHGVQSRMCLFEGENHELSRSGTPSQRQRRLREISDWLARWLEPARQPVIQ